MKEDRKMKQNGKRNLFVGVALACMIIIIVFTSIVNAGLDPSKMFTKENAGNALCKTDFLGGFCLE